MGFLREGGEMEAPSENEIGLVVVMDKATLYAHVTNKTIRLFRLD